MASRRPRSVGFMPARTLDGEGLGLVGAVAGCHWRGRPCWRGRESVALGWLFRVTAATPVRVLRYSGSVGCFAQRPVQDARVAEPVPQGVLQPGDRDEVLWGAGVLVCDGRVAAQHRLRQVRQRG